MIEHVLGMDVGGTTVKWSLFAVQDGTVQAEALRKGSRPTGRGFAGFPQSVRAAVEDAMDGIAGGDKLVVGIGVPGRFLPPDFERVAAHTAHRLCPPDKPEEFDNTLFKQMLREAMPQGVRLKVENDAIVQLMGLLAGHGELDGVKENDVVGYFGPGTGLGGGFARRSASGYTVETDGHINHILILLSPEDTAKVEAIEAARGVNIPKRDGRYTAEGLCCGTALEMLCGLPADQARRLDEDATLREQFRDEILLAGRAMAGALLAIRSGEFEKLAPEDTWPRADQILAAQARYYFFGGGVGQSQHLGEMILAEASDELTRNGADDYTFHVVGENPATRAAAEMALGAFG